ncbi:MAG: leucine-rich repeat domain-containing protein [Lewinellaceae bacterium]|nr:leucine-rich repeat domain-containing protein [Lewinellaceae bacterium]
MKAFNLETVRQHKDQIEEVYLHGLGMTEWPDLLFGLPQLRVLCLSGNRLSAAPEQIGKLTQLQVLDLSGNGLSALPKSLSALRALTEVNLADNQFTRFPAVLGKLTALQKLDLGANKLRALPRRLANVRHLRSLRLHNNRLRELPTEWEPMEHLSELQLDRNHLSELPAWVFNLARIQTLSLAQNKLSEFPLQAGQLATLEILNLRHNALTGLPEAMGRLPVLRRLWVDHNRLTKLPLSFGKLHSLRLLSCQGNFLTHWPVHLGELPRLEALDLGNNQLARLPAQLGKWPALSELNLQRNRLHELPDTLSRLPRLKELQLGRNHFASFPESLVTSTSLEIVSGVAGSAKALRFMQACQRAHLEERCCLELFRLWSGALQPGDLSPEKLVRGMGLPLPSLQKTIRSFFLQKERNPVKPGSVIAILGRTRQPKSAWKKQMEVADLEWAETSPRHPTHIVLGGGILDIPVDWLEKDLTFLEEATLFQLLQDVEKNYLQKVEDHGQWRRLLQSKQEASLRLALTLFKKGGVPPAAMTDLYLAWRAVSEPKLKKGFRDLLLLHASTPGRRFLESNAVFQTLEQLHQACRDTEFDADRIWTATHP